MSNPNQTLSSPDKNLDSPESIELFKHQTADICLRAIHMSNNKIPFVRVQSEELCLEAISKQHDSQ